MTTDIDRLDPERRLALSYVPAAQRDAMATLWTLDTTIGAAIAGGSQPLVKSIKLAWWRERLDELGSIPPPPEPVLQAVARDLLPLGIDGARLAAMIEGWEVLASAERLGPEELAAYAEWRGGLLFHLSARLLGDAGADPVIGAAGRGWALVDLARRSSDQADATAALAAASEIFAVNGPGRWPGHMRVLGMLTMLARRDATASPAALERQGSPGRMLRMFHHRLTGR